MKKILIVGLVLLIAGTSGVFAQTKDNKAKGADAKTTAVAPAPAKADATATPAKDVKADVKAAPAADAKVTPAVAKPAGKSLYTAPKAKYEVIGDDKGDVYIYDKGAVAAKIGFVKVDGKNINITYNKTDAKVASAADVTAQLNGTFCLKAYAGGAKAIYDFWSAQGAAPAAAPKKK